MLQFFYSQQQLKNILWQNLTYRLQGPAQPLQVQVSQFLKKLERNPAFTIVIQEEVRMELTMQNNKIQTQILCSQQKAEVSLSRINEHEQEKTDQRVMTLFHALKISKVPQSIYKYN
ncbi:Hypothetical_protein [Hexamita inflata]|uniref:Hypothetical_protein n=1 Tax=Hexamita inflata TaxID=28002 RepID=A0AA86P833_9EUKA|nr:Hypothetical protein HINF_LOCUS20348 [Hexamita inflata]